MVCNINSIQELPINEDKLELLYFTSKNFCKLIVLHSNYKINKLTWGVSVFQ